MSAIYKMSKCILRVVLRQGTELGRLIQSRDASHSSTKGAIRLPDDDDGNDDLPAEREAAINDDDEVRLIQQTNSKQHRRRSSRKEDAENVASWRIGESFR